MREMMGENREFSLKGKIVTDSGIADGYVTVRDGVITGVGGSCGADCMADFGDAFIVPGFIDMHIHGIHLSLVDNGPGDLAEMCRTLPQYGVTGFLPTVAPRPEGEDAGFLSRLAGGEYEGAEILGFHLEGPFLKLTGALNSDSAALPDAARVNSLIEAAKPYKAVFSVSPDVGGIAEVIPVMTGNDAPVFITHTAATVSQTQKAIEAGARHATHFYDVFPAPEVTEPGVRPCGAVEAVLADPRVSVDFILDGVHVDPVAVKMALACKADGPGRVCLITDSNVGAGLEPGRFVFGNMGEVSFEYRGAPARAVKDNTLAGSGLTMDQALRNAVKWLELGLPETIRLLSANPAAVLGLGGRKGRLAAGYDADFVVMDSDLNILRTWVGGECRYRNN